MTDEEQARKKHDDAMLRLGEFLREKPPPLQFGLVLHEAKGEHEAHWSVVIEWGREAPDSPMVGAAAYGMGEVLAEALTTALNDTRTEQVIHDSEIMLARLVSAVEGDISGDAWRHLRVSGGVRTVLNEAHATLGHSHTSQREV